MATSWKLPKQVHIPCWGWGGCYTLLLWTLPHCYTLVGRRCQDNVLRNSLLGREKGRPWTPPWLRNPKNGMWVCKMGSWHCIDCILQYKRDLNFLIDPKLKVQVNLSWVWRTLATKMMVMWSWWWSRWLQLQRNNEKWLPLSEVGAAVSQRRRASIYQRSQRRRNR